MKDYNAKPHKTAGADAKPARIELRTGEAIAATHHFVCEDGWLAVYESTRENGITAKIPPANVARVTMVDEHGTTTAAAAAADALDIDPSRGVIARGEAWIVRSINDDGTVQLEPVTAGALIMCGGPSDEVGEPTIRIPADEIDAEARPGYERGHTTYDPDAVFNDELAEARERADEVGR